MSDPVLTPDQMADEINRTAGELTEKLAGKIIKLARPAMIQSVRDNFQGSHGPDNEAWSPIKFRARGGDKPLMDTGLLRASIVGNAQGHVEQITPDSIELGTSRPGANLLHAGGTVVPKGAKALSIPLTKEAARVGSARRFPRPLTMLWSPGANSGVLAEIDKEKTKATKGEKAKSKTIRKQSVRVRKLTAQINQLNEQLKTEKRSGKRQSIHKKIGRLRVQRYQAAGKSNSAKSKRHQSRQKRKGQGITIHYALVKSVTIPARPFIGFGTKLIARLNEITAKVVGGAFGGKPSNGGE